MRCSERGRTTSSCPSPWPPGRGRSFRVDVVHLDGLRSWSSTSRALDFVDSYGLRELVVTRKRQQEIGGDVILRSPTKGTLRTLEIVGLTQVFTIA